VENPLGFLLYLIHSDFVCVFIFLIKNDIPPTAKEATAASLAINAQSITVPSTP
jgi:hypothetical protein